MARNTQVRLQSLLKPITKTEQHRHLVYKNLFPSRNYFYMIFVKNLDILKKTKCVSNKFSKTFMFISRLLDVFSYLDFFRQFNVFKTLFLDEKNIHYIEKIRKINIGEISFIRSINESMENNNFRIFGKMIDNE